MLAIEIGLMIYYLVSEEFNALYLSIVSYKAEQSIINNLQSTSTIKTIPTEESEDSINIDNCDYQKVIKKESRPPIKYFAFLFLRKVRPN